MGVPETEYAWNGETCLAYQVLGEGSVDLLYVQGYTSHVDLNWESRYLSRFLRGLAQHARLIVTDRRGWGCSDRFSAREIQDADTFSDDLQTVLDAAGSDRAVVMASEEAALLACLFAAAHPERTAALVLVDAFPTFAWTEETPWAPTVQEWIDGAEQIRREWGRPAFLDRVSGDMPEAELLWFMRFTRASMTPAALAAEMERNVGVDIRRVLPTIQVPTLVFVDPDGTFSAPAEASRYVAAHIPGATSIEVRSGDGPSIHGLLWYSRGERIVQEVGRFLASLRLDQSSFDRVLATVLFTDIVDSTAQAASLGDRAWRELRERHDRTIRSLIGRYRGREVKTLGDGFLATFDGPARAVRCATAIAAAMQPLGIEVRAGLHTGEVELDGNDVAGVAVAIGARVGAMAGPSEVLVSQTVKDLVAGSGLSFEDAGEHELKGVPDRWRLYRVGA